MSLSSHIQTFQKTFYPYKPPATSHRKESESKNSCERLLLKHLQAFHVKSVKVSAYHPRLRNHIDAVARVLEPVRVEHGGELLLRVAAAGVLWKAAHQKHCLLELED